jgi:hydrogenase maturation protease
MTCVEDRTHPAGQDPNAAPHHLPSTVPAATPGESQADASNDVAAEVLVVGVGNDLRGDDGAGRAVVEELLRRAVPGMRAIWSHQLVPELAEQIATAAVVVFVDAGHPGTVSAVEVRPLAPGSAAIGAHQAGPAGLLGLAALAGLAVPEAFLVTVPAHDLGLGSRLSPGTVTAVGEAVDRVVRLVLDRDRRPGGRRGGDRTSPGSDGA